MSTATIKTNILYGMGEGENVTDATALTYALRWANASYREIFLRYRFKNLRTRSIFTTTAGQSTYQAPSDLGGFLLLKDETNQTVLDQITPEEMQRDIDPDSITNESFESVTLDVAVDLTYDAFVQYSETVTTTDGSTIYTRDTDYSMDYTNGTITVIDGGSMSNATEYYIDYLYYSTGEPTQYCLEYDETNARYIFRLDPIPSGSFIGSLLYSALPSNLSDSVDPLWNQFEYTIERGGIYYGSLELIDDSQKRNEFKQLYEVAMQALIQLDCDMIPKRQTIPVILKKWDY